MWTRSKIFYIESYPQNGEIFIVFSDIDEMIIYSQAKLCGLGSFLVCVSYSAESNWKKIRRNVRTVYSEPSILLHMFYVEVYLFVYVSTNWYQLLLCIYFVFLKYNNSTNITSMCPLNEHFFCTKYILCPQR